ncbi:type IV conjugative transfer system protein TraL [Azomonas macrocytogenes]|uniref:Conjugal transfer pilus assembly protein TraL n=1 Tax=Azomonas macrocytogenes TaxID=69962 RepID=A0A839TA40_AZOMA|nr:type IV conjugative transfer system protein TraL [Azomonas macrocytogenes]MBB3105326.1 conjugal transfer pilus assembly protein TraL [Azomonas macrocytogenes]
MTPVKIPRRVDDPPHLLLWSADELAPILLGLFFGVMLKKVGIMLLLGFALTSVYKRFRQHYPDGYLLHMLYWAGFMFSKAKSMKNPYVRRYLP